MNAAELMRALIAAKGEIDSAMAEYDRAIRADAEADDTARRAKARAYIACREQIGSKATVAHVEAAVDLETSDAQKAARLAEGLKRSAAQALESKMRWMQALQSAASLAKAEAQLGAWTPREVESA